MTNELPYINHALLKEKIRANDTSKPLRFILMRDIRGGEAYVRFSTEDVDFITIDQFQREALDAREDILLECCGGGLAKITSGNHVILYGESDQIGPFRPEVLEVALGLEGKANKEFSYTMLF